MRFLLVSHEEDTPLKNTLDWLHEGHHSHTLCRLFAGESLPALNDFDALILFGGEMNVDQEDIFPWLKTEKDFIRRSIAADKKILGLCLGAQLIADVLGARVSRHSHWEIGWFPIETLLQDEPLMVFQWHGYSFDLPAGARLIASGTHWKNQGYGLGRQVAGFQFHPEATREWILTAAAEKKPAGAPPLVQGEKEILQQMDSLTKMTCWYFRFLDYFFLEKI